MSTHLDTRLHIDSWDEKPFHEQPDGAKFTRAEVRLSTEGDPAGGSDTAKSTGFEGEASWDALMYYTPDGRSTYLGLMRVTGRLGGRTGGFVLQGTGTFDGARAVGESSVVPGSATGELVGLRGTARSVSTHADYPYMPLSLHYQIEESDRG